MSDTQVQKLEQELFSRIDGAWLRSRNLKPAKELEALAKLERVAYSWIIKNLDATQKSRLVQLEYNSQAFRALLRDDVAKELSLTDDQRAKYSELAQATDTAQFEFKKAVYSSTGASEDDQKALAEKINAERDGFKEIFQPEQIQSFVALTGDTFDTASLERIFPMPPELVDAKHWINGPVRLKDLRGKVVLLHFYAYQCGNCKANFDIYRRWHDQLSSKGVAVVGIQSPEVQSERDPAKVKAAAKEHNLRFPILVDVEKKNWDAYGTTMWPTVFVIDQKGYLRKMQMGELQWNGATYDKDIEQLVDKLLEEQATS
ncbi:MAG: redoxin domain-containing protein [Aureliella sp.]